MRFEWDEKKAATTLARHGVSFEEAATVFVDSLSDTFDDPDRSVEERRFLIIGEDVVAAVEVCTQLSFSPSLILLSRTQN